jgi:hypothetical protein
MATKMTVWRRASEGEAFPSHLDVSIRHLELRVVQKRRKKKKVCVFFSPIVDQSYLILPLVQSSPSSHVRTANY